MANAAELVSQADRLASLPAAYLRVKQVLDDPHGSIPQLRDALATDPAMTSRLLRVVNSPFYGFPGRIDTVTRALHILGMQQVHDVVLSWAIASAFANLRTQVVSMEVFWRSSVARAIAAKQLGRHAGFIDSERLFVEGLLSDIGHLVMFATVPRLATEALDLSARTRCPLDGAERTIVGCDYAEVGAALVAAWALPPAFEEPIACQIDPSKADAHRLEAAILHVAGALAGSPRGEASALPLSFALDLLGLDEPAVQALRAQVAQDLDAVVASYFPELAAA
jgi:HD-like signal output (HDOD) protein